MMKKRIIQPYTKWILAVFIIVSLTSIIVAFVHFKKEKNHSKKENIIFKGSSDIIIPHNPKFYLNPHGVYLMIIDLRATKTLYKAIDTTMLILDSGNVIIDSYKFERSLFRKIDQIDSGHYHVIGYRLSIGKFNIPTKQPMYFYFKIGYTNRYNEYQEPLRKLYRFTLLDTNKEVQEATNEQYNRVSDFIKENHSW